MKGLLIKDFKLMMLQRNFFILIIAIVLGIMIFNEDVTFPFCFLSFIMSLFVVTTISYDDFDNGNTFLFTLPITRKIYIHEKYVLGILLGGLSWILAISFAVIVSAAKSILVISDLFTTAFLIFPIIILMQSVMIPFQIKYGGEVGRIAMIGTFGVIAVIGIVAVKIANLFFNIDLIYIFNTLNTLNMNTLIFIFMIFAFICLLVSLKISLIIIEHKEF